MSISPNAAIATLVVFLFIGIALLAWKCKEFVEHFAHSMFAARQAEPEPEQGEEELQSPSPRRRRRRSSESMETNV